MKIDAETDPTVKAQLNAEWELHKRKAKRAYQELKDGAKAKVDSDLDVITFDLQQALVLLRTSVVFYKRQMWVYNLGVHDCGTDKGVMCMWDESMGSHEIGSCLLKFMKSSISYNLLLRLL